ncbi:MAG: 50S ribosomal protein L18 [Patescibacteria group bacterium]
MKKAAAKREKRKRRHTRVRARIQGTSTRPRISVFRSNKHVLLQLIDDSTGKTIVSARDVEGVSRGKKASVGTRANLAFEAGKRLALRALEKKISAAVFDRGGYTYHGIVKMVADGARKGGLQF